MNTETQQFSLGKVSLLNMAGVEGRLQEVVKLAITLTRVDFGIPATGGLRTAQQQKELYDAGKSKADGKLKVSAHQSGKAIDFYAYVEGKASWDRSHLTEIALAMFEASSRLKTPLVWGGNWKSFPDYPHIQLADFRS